VQRGVTLPAARQLPRVERQTAALLPGPSTFGDWQPSQRYPDPLIKISIQSFAKYVRSAKVGSAFLPLVRGPRLSAAADNF
jgi:hypothetical protein